MHYFCVFLIVFARGAKSKTDDWEYTDLRCRDNENHPVDWWYIYKPPIERPILHGTNFTYILPDTHGKWQMSEYEIIADSMVQHTLEPLFRENYKNQIAFVIANGKTEFGYIGGSSVYAIMVANEMGGFFIGHSIPGFPDLNKGNANFPSTELPFGHFLMCLYLDLPTLNLIASLLKEAKPNVQMNVPINLRPHLPFWQYFNRHDMHQFMSLAIDFKTVGTLLPVHVMIRRPNDKTCLYTQFAKKKEIILDVYEHDSNLHPFCVANVYGVRQIKSISLKIPDHVFYIPNASDKMSFAVSTAAYWQTKGSAPEQYWACVSTIENKEKNGNGGIIICVQDYSVWWTFDNLKIKENSCYFFVFLSYTWNV